MTTAAKLKPMEKANNSYWLKTRKFFNDIHLWAGLISGLVVFVVCLTGTIYVYNSEIRELGANHLYKVDYQKGLGKITPEAAIEKVRQQSQGAVTTILIEESKKRPYQITVREEGSQSRFGTIYYVDPYKGTILGNSNEHNSAAEFMGYLFSLHRWLLLDKIENPLIGELSNRTLGSYITGAATILFTLGVITGMVIWFPQRVRNFRQGLKVKFGKSWKRTNHDLHNTLAFYSCIILFLMGVTGPFWSYPWYREGLQKTLGTYKPRVGQGPGPGNPSAGQGRRGQQAPSTGKESELPLSIFEYISSADAVLDYPGNYRISLPQGGGKNLNIQKSKIGFFAPAASDRVVLDMETADLTEKDIFREKPFNVRVSSSIKALHVGDVYGQFSKFLYFLSCLIATSLPVTGTLIWINKLKKKRARKKVRPVSQIKTMKI
ncbi:putative iron-regulated transmembrane protein [Indibacter alkaliphilus LW1]|uniref:Iron-regulated transmembrane protein n=4 Tax=Indibacter TaxID=647744 RepID=S2DPU8_INDAL|nr:putative iron-regulated transmembrane protein [Indibacter alkaliphilus LW1]